VLSLVNVNDFRDGRVAPGQAAPAAMPFLPFKHAVRGRPERERQGSMQTSQAAAGPRDSIAEAYAAATGCLEDLKRLRSAYRGHLFVAGPDVGQFQAAVQSLRSKFAKLRQTIKPTYRVLLLHQGQLQVNPGRVVLGQGCNFFCEAVYKLVKGVLEYFAVLDEATPSPDVLRRLAGPIIESERGKQWDQTALDAAQAGLAAELVGLLQALRESEAGGTTAGPRAASAVGTDKRRQLKARWLSDAMLLVRDHPDWSDAQIAQAVGRNPSQLSRSREYQMAAAMARGSRDRVLRGRITVAEATGLCDVEAEAPVDGPADDKSDRGQPIAGSKLFREYCAECGDPMRVAHDQVGKKPVCEACES
jgi:hypothetical protein